MPGKLILYSKLRAAGTNIVPLRVKVWHAQIDVLVKFANSEIGTSIATGPFDRNIDAKNWLRVTMGLVFTKEVKTKRIDGFRVVRTFTYSGNQRSIGNAISGVYIESVSPQKFVHSLGKYLNAAVREEMSLMLRIL